jgi:putative peptidoglycan lipid II flippase
MIATVILLAPRFGGTLQTQIFALAYGVLLAGIAQMLFQLPALRKEGFTFRWVAPWQNETVRKVIRQMLPGTIGVAAFQINVLVTNLVAIRLDAPIVASFRYAVSLMELPQGVFGLSLATYLLPTLSGLAVDKKMSEFRSTLAQGLGYMVFINALAAVLLFTLAEPIVRLLFEHGEFNQISTHDTSLAVVCLSPGLVAFSMVNILARAFYALGDTATPMRMSIACFAINLLVVFALIGPYRQGGMGVANTVSAVLNVGFLLAALRRKIGELELSGLRQDVLGIVASALIAGAIAFGTNRWFEARLGHGNLVLKLAVVFAPMLLATLSYFAVANWFKISFPKEILGMMTEKFRKLRHSP